MATCAGLILLADKIENSDRNYFATMPIEVRRNAYGRQLSSFAISDTIEGIVHTDFEMVFIRAPYITQTGMNVKILARDKEKHIVAVKYGNQLAFAFHPEFAEDYRVHKYFLQNLYKLRW